MSLDKKQHIFAQQPDAYLSQANPVTATLYTVLGTVRNARIASIEADVTWATTQPTPLEVVVTIDGISMIFSLVNPVTATKYYASMNPTVDAANQMLVVASFTTGATNTALMIPYVLEGRSVKVEVRITWATTQPTPLVCRVKYAKL